MSVKSKSKLKHGGERKELSPLVPTNCSAEVRRIISQLKRPGDFADKKVLAIGGWKRTLPTRRGLWFQALWQKAGYYHVQRHPIYSSVAYLRKQSQQYRGADEWWVGPFGDDDILADWTLNVNPPNDHKLSHGADNSNRGNAGGVQ